ncbi:MAG: glycosyl hydrolase family 28 protein [Candidatus Sumerlaeota bacterium]
MDSNKLKIDKYPLICPRSEDFLVRINGEEALPFRACVADFVSYESDGAVEVEVEVAEPIKEAEIRPRSRGIACESEGNVLRFRLKQPQCVSVEIAGKRSLYIYGNEPDEKKPSPDDDNVLYFAGGQVYELGYYQLQTGQTVYIEGGAVVRGGFFTEDTSDVQVRGRGVIDNGYFLTLGLRHRSILFERSENCLAEDVIIINSSCWNVELRGSRDCVVRGVKQIGEVSTSDGVDVVSSKNILVENCFLRNNDDCIAIKAGKRLYNDGKGAKWGTDVENVTVRNCVLINDTSGSAIEIGHELRTNHVKDIVFSNCDILSVHGWGAAFSINNADRAAVSNVLYEDIRVEHHFTHLINFRVVRSRFGRDEERGQIRDIILRNIDVTLTPFNQGYTVSHIGGLSPEHTVENVTIENLTQNGEKIMDGDAIELYTRHARNIVFK